jgi:ribonuclease HII
MKLPNFSLEKELWEKGFDLVVGVDEVGRGSFAGPVVAGAVVFKKNSYFTDGLLSKINDSKLLDPKIRRLISYEIKKEALFYTITSAGVYTINKVGVGKATQIAIRKCIKSFMKRFTSRPFVLADGFHIKYIKGVGLSHQKGIIKGDRKSISIAAASIIAKVHRDSIMRKMNKRFPGYGFYTNKGYGTKFHQIAMRKYGLSEIHRTSFNFDRVFYIDK